MSIPMIAAGVGLLFFVGLGLLLLTAGGEDAGTATPPQPPPVGPATQPPQATTPSQETNREIDRLEALLRPGLDMADLIAERVKTVVGSQLSELKQPEPDRDQERPEKAPAPELDKEANVKLAHKVLLQHYEEQNQLHGDVHGLRLAMALWERHRFGAAIADQMGIGVMQPVQMPMAKASEEPYIAKAEVKP